MIQKLKIKLRIYWQLIKSLQTILLLLTGITGFFSSRCPYTSWELTLGMMLSLFLAISGTTVYNMIWDRDIDAVMDRTKQRPLPANKISVKEAVILGTTLNVLGLGLAYYLSPLYALVIFAGLFIDFVIYTIWLKRTSAWSIVWGGISGGMPILAGRVLGVGEIDLIGLLLASSVLFWIPTHIMTFNMRHFDDYNKAEIPTFASKYGFKNVRLIIALSTITSAIAFAVGAFSLGLSWGFVRLLLIFAFIALGFAFYSILYPSDKSNFQVFKVASLYMASAMLIIIVGSIYY
ncbi:MAG: protoheme IX farnesyltransferase [Bacteroidales bacterium]|jgi:protoheme IX farnesyltransferase|nr:protoheme IX farnesyltransferase [Bacteroidales bacterium]